MSDWCKDISRKYLSFVFVQLNIIITTKISVNVQISILYQWTQLTQWLIMANVFVKYTHLQAVAYFE